MGTENTTTAVTTAQHTAGPWWAGENDYSVYAADDQGDFLLLTVADSFPRGDHNREEMRATQQVAAAAPDLLAAAELAVEAHYLGGSAFSLPTNVRRELEAAIAKARGTA